MHLKREIYIKSHKIVFLFELHTCNKRSLLTFSNLVSLLVFPPRLTFIVACFAFIVDFPEKVLVVRELFFVHASHLAFVGFLVHLATQEFLVVLIDTGNLAVETLLLKLVVLLVGLPDHGLLVVECLLSLLASLLLGHLAAQQNAHLLFLETVTLHAALVFQSRSHFLILLETQKGLLLTANTVLLLSDHVTGKSVHKVLGASLASTELTKAIVFLLV